MRSFVRTIFKKTISLLIMGSVYYKHIARMQGWEIPYETWLNNFHFIILALMWILLILLAFTAMGLHITDLTTIGPDELARSNRIANLYRHKDGWLRKIYRNLGWLFIIGYGVVGAWGFMVVAFCTKVMGYVLDNISKEFIRRLESLGYTDFEEISNA